MNENTISIENFISFDLRHDYKVSKNQIIEKYKLNFVISGVSCYAAAAMFAVEVASGKSEYIVAIYPLLAIGCISLLYPLITEWTGYAYSRCFYNVTTIFQVILIWLLLLVFSVWITLFFQGSLLLLGTFFFSSIIIAIVITYGLVCSRIANGYYACKTRKSKTNRYLVASIAICLIVVGRIIALYSMSVIGYALILFVSLGGTNTITFYGLQLYYAKKHNLQDLLPQVRIADNKEKGESGMAKEPHSADMETAQKSQTPEFEKQELGSMGNKYNFGKKWGK